MEVVYITIISDGWNIPHSKPCISNLDKIAVESVLESEMIAEGSLVSQFEDAISNYMGLSGGIATSSGTDALFLALKALDIGIGDEVIIPTYVCRSVWDAVRSTGATPILCDIGNDWCANADLIAPHITQQTKAIVPVHIFGIAADVAQICDFGIPVIEDCCQALGAKQDNQMVGTFGDFCFISFNATKLLTTAEGGMVLTKEPDLLEKLKQLKLGHMDQLVQRYRRPLSNLQAALGLSQLSQYDQFLEKRICIADYYFSKIRDTSEILLPLNVRDRSIFFRYPIRTTIHVDYLRSLFSKKGIQVRKGVDTLLHRQCGLSPKGFTGAEQCFQKTLSIPIYPSLSEREINYIVKATNEIFNEVV